LNTEKNERQDGPGEAIRRLAEEVVRLRALLEQQALKVQALEAEAKHGKPPPPESDKSNDSPSL